MRRNEESHRKGVLIAQATLDRLEREGLIAKTGEYQTAPNGRVDPVYTFTELGKRTPDWLAYLVMGWHAYMTM